MNTGPLVKVIEKQPPELINALNAELQSNLGTSYYRRLSEEELLRRHSAVYAGLAQWLSSRDETALQKSGEDLGKRRFAEGIPLGQVVLTLILVEKHLWEFLDSSAEHVDPDVRRAGTEFFQKDAYFTARGYEESLAVSNRLAQAAPEHVSQVRAPMPPPKKEAAKAEPDLEISRGGQVGELGG